MRWRADGLEPYGGVTSHIGVHQSVFQSCRRGDACAAYLELGKLKSNSKQPRWRYRSRQGCVIAAMIRAAPCAILCRPTSLHSHRKAKYRLCFSVVCDVQHCAPPQRWLVLDGERRGADIASPSPRWRGSAVAPFEGNSGQNINTFPTGCRLPLAWLSYSEAP